MRPARGESDQAAWAEAGSRFTALFEALAIEWLKAASQKGVAQMLQLSWDEIHGILERAVQRGLERRKREPMVYLGVDEKAFRKGHNYLTLVNDLSDSRVLYVAEAREKKSLDGFWGTLTEEQKAGIEAVAMEYVGSLHRFGTRTPGGSREENCVRQISHR